MKSSLLYIPLDSLIQLQGTKGKRQTGKTDEEGDSYQYIKSCRKNLWLLQSGKKPQPIDVEVQGALTWEGEVLSTLKHRFTATEHINRHIEQILMLKFPED